MAFVQLYEPICHRYGFDFAETPSAIPRGCNGRELLSGRDLKSISIVRGLSIILSKGWMLWLWRLMTSAANDMRKTMETMKIRTPFCVLPSFFLVRELGGLSNGVFGSVFIVFAFL